MTFCSDYLGKGCRRADCGNSHELPDDFKCDKCLRQHLSRDCTAKVLPMTDIHLQKRPCHWCTSDDTYGANGGRVCTVKIVRERGREDLHFGWAHCGGPSCVENMNASIRVWNAQKGKHV